MIIDEHLHEPPFFSICIPHYNRTNFLLVLLRSIREQRFQDFEICLSDGGSNDRGQETILNFLRQSQIAFRYKRSEENLPYDRNLRSSLELARGRYCLLFGNDDCLADKDSLETLTTILTRWDFPEVAISNYFEISNRTVVRRIASTGILGAGPQAAVANFRNFSFVSGIVLDCERCQRFPTNKWDDSEMYQMYLGCRILALGGRLLGIEQALVNKDVRVPGERADSYAQKPRIRRCKVSERRLPLSQYGVVALDAIAGAGIGAAQYRYYARRIFQQVLLFTYPPWLVEYRRVQSWRFAVGVALGMRPGVIFHGCKVGWFLRIYLWLLYLGCSVAGLFVPKVAFLWSRPWLYKLAKRQ
jgi:glycosyltransferase involved in cell wall biosynthesis